MEIILKYFPELNPVQIERLARLQPLYEEWNQKINVISRKDIGNLYVHHVLHSMAIARIIRFAPEAAVLDLGTGGGLPGIPLAILFPESYFTLIDGTQKKIKVVNAIVQGLQLDNVTALHARAEEQRRQFDFVVCRAVAPLNQLLSWSQPLIHRQHRHALPNGLITLKGGDIRTERKSLPRGTYSEVFPLFDFFDEPYYQEKYAVYVQA